MPELRKDPILGKWVIIATERDVRPSDFTVTRPSLSGSFCPFCPGNESVTPPEVFAIRDSDTPNAPDWRVRVVPNKYPALKIEGDLDKEAVGLYDMMNGVGAHEVVIECPNHDADLCDLPVDHIADVFAAFQARILDLTNDRRFRYVVVFKNHGAAAGASLAHSHSQLIALPILPSNVREKIDGAKRYFDFRERCVFCDMIAQELRDNTRVVAASEHVVAIAPFASRFPFETWLLPRTHEARFEHASEAVRRDLARVFQDVMRRMNLALDSPPFNFALHTAPLGGAPLEHYHWHLEVIPKLTRVAGFEWGSGFHINPTPPEKAASFLRSLDPS